MARISAQERREDEKEIYIDCGVDVPILRKAYFILTKFNFNNIVYISPHKISCFSTPLVVSLHLRHIDLLPLSL